MRCSGSHIRRRLEQVEPLLQAELCRSLLFEVLAICESAQCHLCIPVAQLSQHVHFYAAPRLSVIAATKPPALKASSFHFCQVSVDELGSGIASIRPQSLVDLMKARALLASTFLSIWSPS